jgi:hypothetical protein
MKTLKTWPAIARAAGVHPNTVRYWARTNPEFARLVRRAKGSRWPEIGAADLRRFLREEGRR